MGNIEIKKDYVIVTQISSLKIDHSNFSTLDKIVEKSGLQNVVRIEGPIVYQVLVDPENKTFSREASEAYKFTDDKYGAIGKRNTIKYGNPMIIPESALLDFLNTVKYKIWDKENNKVELKFNIDNLL